MTDLAAITVDSLKRGEVWLLLLADGYRAAVYHDGDPRWPYRAGRHSYDTYTDLHRPAVWPSRPGQCA